jgi:L-ascorbate metabolism protein UlaG (beta-lactamase superfamily)
MASLRKAGEVRVTWYGHACFRLEGGGLAVVTDPYTPGPAGLQPVAEPADVVVMSSALDEAHSCASAVPGSPRVLNAIDAIGRPTEIAPGVVVEAFAASEGSDRPDDPKANALYRFELDGVAVCHMGDIGIPLAPEHVERLRGRVDVLFALAGAGLTIALEDLDEAIAGIAPRIVIPMHFRIPSLLYAAGPVEDFLARRRGDPIVEHDGSSVEITAELADADRPTIHVLRPAGDPRASEASGG